MMSSRSSKRSWTTSRKGPASELVDFRSQRHLRALVVCACARGVAGFNRFGIGLDFVALRERDSFGFQGLAVAVGFSLVTRRFPVDAGCRPSYIALCHYVSHGSRFRT